MGLTYGIDLRERVVAAIEGELSNRTIRDAYGLGKYEKLLALKKKYDPENLFRMNQNIRPV